jgi:phosphatidylglycerol:prolipoprotein diacylglycerol transferase
MFEAFSFGPFLIWTRAVFLLLGIWLAFEFFLRLSKSAHLSLEHFRERAWWYLLAFLIGARIFAVLGQYRVYLRDPLRLFVVWDGGFSFLGGAIGIGLLLHWVTRTHRTTFLQWLDVLLPATTLGLAFDWLGKFTSGQSYGRPTDMFWGVTYEAMHVRYVVPVQPVQFFYALFFFILTFLLLIIRKNAKRAGSETLVGIVLASLATFFFEYLRGDFSIPVFATQLDFVVLLFLFVSLGLFAVVELRLTLAQMYLYEAFLFLSVTGYVVIRSWLAFPSFELRFSQFLAVLALLATVVYVIVHRRKYPHL